MNRDPRASKASKELGQEFVKDVLTWPRVQRQLTPRARESQEYQKARQTASKVLKELEDQL